MTPFVLSTVAALTLVAQSSVPRAPQPFSRDSIRLAVAPALFELRAGAQSDWGRVMRLAPNDDVTVVTGPATIAGRVVRADPSGLTLRLDSGGTTTFDRASIQEVRLTTRRRGSRLGAVIGAGIGGFTGYLIAINLAMKDCEGSCTGEKVGVGAALVGLPIGGGVAGYYLWPRRTSVEVIYTRPML
jgi:hypothetical protein